MPDARSRKYQQAAWVYLHVGILYLAAVWVMAGAGLLPEDRGPVWVWMIVGTLIVAAVFLGLWKWQNPWFARAIWALHALRVPALIRGAFFPLADTQVPSAFYLTALFVVLLNLGMLARAAWDL